MKPANCIIRTDFCVVSNNKEHGSTQLPENACILSKLFLVFRKSLSLYHNSMSNQLTDS